MSAPIWHAFDLESVKTNGRTRPLVAWCYSADDEKAKPRRFLIKSLGQPEVYEATLFAELFGNSLAREFGIATPAPALVFLSDPFVRSVAPRLPAGLQLRGGEAVGCEFLPNLEPLLSDFPLSPALRAQATSLFAFDLFTSNVDRRIGNPNCGLLGGELLAYDFESCFSFLLSLPAFSPKPWEVAGLGIAKRHIFYEELVSNGADWKPFLERLDVLDERRLRELVKDFPSPWLSSAGRVVDHLLQAQENSNKLALQLEMCLHS